MTPALAVGLAAGAAEDAVRTVADIAWRVEPLARVRRIEQRIDALTARESRARSRGRTIAADALAGRIRWWTGRLAWWEGRA